MSLHAEVKIDAILHATEDIEKIFESFLSNFDLDKKDFEIQNLTGHFDNPITLLSINLKKKNAEVFISKIQEEDFNIEDEDRKSVVRERV